MLTKAALGGILSERLARGTENWIGSRETERNAGRPFGKKQKKCLTNARARDKINEFAPNGANDLKENRNKGIGAKSSEKT